MNAKNLKARFGTAMAVGMVAASMLAGMPVHAANGLQDGTQKLDQTTTSGNVKITYSTEGGKWTEPDDTPDNPDDNPSHDNGTYLVTIPTAISYEGMKIGAVSESVDYTVNIKGAIASDKKVSLTITDPGKLTNGSFEITEKTTHDKTEWSAEEVFGSATKDGGLNGTDHTDNVALSGTAKAAGAYTGTVKYTAALVDA